MGLEVVLVTGFGLVADPRFPGGLAGWNKFCLVFFFFLFGFHEPSRLSMESQVLLQTFS